MSNSESAPLKTGRRWFQYSLRSFLILLTALAVWLGVVVNRAREQREAVKALESEGIILQYDWQPAVKEWDLAWPPYFLEQPPPTPEWLRGWVDDNYFQRVEGVYIHSTRSDRTLISKEFVDTVTPYLRRLPCLKTVRLDGIVPTAIENRLKKAVPNCEFYHLKYYVH